MHCGMGSAILSQLDFPGESHPPKFPKEKFVWDNTVVNKILKNEQKLKPATDSYSIKINK